MKTLVNSVISSCEVDMSGRLVILGKKGYCPWNSKNLTRIRRDEERHREAQEREQEKQADKASASRLSALKKTANEGDGHVERFSLFEAEEGTYFDASNKVQGSKSETCQLKETTKKNDEKNHQEFPSRHRLLQRHSFTKRDKRSEFYLKPPSMNVPLGEKEVQRHRDMDPMKEFHEVQEVMQDGISHREMVQNIKSDCDVHERKRSSKRHRSSGDGCSGKVDEKTEGRKEKHRKKKKRHREDAPCRKHRKSSTSKREKSSLSTRKSNISIEELRKKRRKREEQERQRQDAFLSTENFGERHKTMERSRNLFHSAST